MSPEMDSFSDPETHFRLVTSDTSVGHDGLRRGEPTGEVACCECGRVAETVEEIPHDTDCSQRGVVSRWWLEAFVLE
ncbi:hypothetical protein Hbl1158_10270 [Halobaculum sp. CBA1158]|uniref:hypothetical protein n=1 Tax=Halobaculum sp. CBA1158 TaxID=2904243 RepID=UPI001F458BC0|nr:hypothetical protein [Halobaculum sp. CBA1158]UIO98919.1 hypothetical protein Hbl1158_10270 [Halobaculum sp. CBA1158]